MYDSGKVISGLIIFVLIITFPIWYNHGVAADVPKAEMPKDKKKCVLPLKEMRPNHMQMLNQWRDDVLRNGDRAFFRWKEKCIRRACRTPACSVTSARKNSATPAMPMRL